MSVVNAFEGNEEAIMHNDGANSLKAIADCLAHRFQKINLAQMDKVVLQDRHDTKCFFSLDKLNMLLPELAEYYYVLDIKNINCLQYDSLYFDTPDFRLYYEHHNKRANRYKIRYRQYVESDKLTFFEVKFKSNKDRTIKNRRRCAGINFELPQESEPLKAICPYLEGGLMPVVRIQYKRITLVSKDFTERATIDLNLQFDNAGVGKQLPNLVIAEIKQDKLNRRSPILQVLHKYHIGPSNISKYCLGIIYCHSSVKNNRFKPLLLKLKKLEAKT